MSHEFYSPNKSNTGGALFATFSSKDGAAFFRLLKQTGWNDANRTGSFKDGKSFNIKLSQDEIGDLIHTIRTKGKSNFYHKFDSDVTTISFSYYEKESEYQGKKTIRKGFGLTCKKGEDEIKVGFSLGAAERLSEILKFAFTHIFSAIYAIDKKQAEEYAAKKKEKTAPKSKTEEYLPSENEKVTEKVKEETKEKDEDSWD